MLHHVTPKLIVLVVLLGASMVGPSLAAAGQSEDSTVTGCLQAGAKEGEFVLVADDKHTYQIQPAEGVELAPHSNHRVELTGTIEETETNSVLKAKALRMIATSWEA